MQKPSPERGGDAFRGTQRGGPVHKGCICRKLCGRLQRSTRSRCSQTVGQVTTVLLPAISCIRSVGQDSCVLEGLPGSTPCRVLPEHSQDLREEPGGSMHCRSAVRPLALFSPS